MSVRLSDDYRTVLPVSGEDGQWILKLPNAEYPKLVEREYGTMCWARDSGFEVPEVRLIDAGSVMDVPSALKMGDGPCYLIRRYDRVEEGGRIHQEDFAQVLDHQPADKYGCTIVRLSQVVLRVMGRAQHERFLDRLVFDIMAGNGDAHLKNWSIVYPDPDGRVPTLAPCYDIVPTILYPKLDPSPGLKFPGSPRFSAIDSMCFKKLLRQTPTLPEHTWDRLARVATRIADAWSTRSRDYLEERDADVLSRHMEQVPVVREWLGLTAK
jgi:serine/threonine-protein kinase HipA